MLKRIKTVYIRLPIAVFFIVTGMAKLIDMNSFLQVLERYPYLSDWMVTFLALLIPMVEILLALLLIGHYKTPSVSLLLMVMVFLFTLISFFLFFSGNIVECGCFGDLIHRENDWKLFAENAIIVAGLYFIVYKESQ